MKSKCKCSCHEFGTVVHGSVCKCGWKVKDPKPASDENFLQTEQWGVIYSGSDGEKQWKAFIKKVESDAYADGYKEALDDVSELQAKVKKKNSGK